MKPLISTCCLVVLVLVSPGDAAAQTPTQGELTQKTADLALASANAMLIPVVDALRLRTKDDPTIQALLDKVTVAASSRILGKGNASASGVRRPLVAVDLSLLLEANSLARLVVCEVLGLPNAKEMFRQVGFNYGQELGKAIANGTAAPAISFHPEDYVSDPLTRETVRVLGVTVGQSIMAGLTLHELGHHVIGHTGRDPKGLAESRADELEADAWAFKEMLRIGMPLWGMHRFLRARAAFESIDRTLGVLPEEAQSTHPTWARREAELARRFDLLSVPHEPFRMFTAVVQLLEPGKPARIVKMHLAAPTGCGPQQGSFIGTVRLGADSTLALCEERNGQVWLYQRDPAVRAEYVVETPNAFVTRVKMRRIGLAASDARAVAESSFIAFRASLAFALTDIALPGFTVDSVIRMTPLGILSQLLGKAGATPSAQAAALPVMRRCLEEQGTMAISYGKGEIPTFDALQTQAAARQKACTEQLEAILGKTVSTRLQAEAFENPVVQNGLTRLLQSATGASASTRPPATEAIRKPVAGPPVGRGRRLAAENRTFEPTKDSARDLLRLFLEPGADTASLVELLRPTRVDYSQVFAEPVATELYEAQRKLFESDVVVAAENDQTSLVLTIGTTSDLIDRTPNGEAFSGGWEVMRPHLKRGIPLISFRFVRPGETLGTRYDGLFYVGDRWVLIPKPWQFIKQ